MNRYYVEVTIQGTNDLRDIFEPIADAVYELTGVIDADLGADFDARKLQLTVYVDADNEVDALSQALEATRTALEASSDHFEAIEQTVRKEHLLPA